MNPKIHSYSARLFNLRETIIFHIIPMIRSYSGVDEVADKFLEYVSEFSPESNISYEDNREIITIRNPRSRWNYSGDFKVVGSIRRKIDAFGNSLIHTILKSLPLIISGVNNPTYKIEIYDGDKFITDIYYNKSAGFYKIN